MAQMISKVPGSLDGLEFYTIILQVLLRVTSSLISDKSE